MAPQMLTRTPRNVRDKQRWLAVAADGDLAEAHYEVYRYMIKSSVADYISRSAMDWLQSAAESGFGDAQYELGRLLLHGDRTGGVEKNPNTARQWWEKAAAKQNHLRAMGTLAAAYEKGRYHLTKDCRQSQMWYQKLLRAYDSRQSIGDVDDRFISSQGRRFGSVSKARQHQENRARRYEQATALERQTMDIEDRYRIEYQKAVNRLKRGDGSKEGRKQLRAKVEQLHQQYARQRELEIEKIKGEEN